MTQRKVLPGSVLPASLAACLLLACKRPPDAHLIQATVSGLAGSGLVLQVNGSDVPVASPGSIALGHLAAGYRYKVTVKTQPVNPVQRCSVERGDGTVGGADVTDIGVSCVTARGVAGTIAGLAGSGLVLRLTLGDVTEDLPIAQGAPSFTFATVGLPGEAYRVEVQAAPSVPSQQCSVDRDHGTLGSADVTDVAVTCKTPRAVSGTVSGLAGSGLVLRLLIDNVPAEDLPVPKGMSAFAFTHPVVSGASFQVAIRDAPGSPAQTCAVQRGGGQMPDADVTDVAVVCSTQLFQIRGTATGLRGQGLMLQNAGSLLAVSADGPFVFTSPDGQPFDVGVMAQPQRPWQTCEVSATGRGTLAGADVDGVTVTCTTNRYTVSASLAGYVGSGLALGLAGQPDLLPPAGATRVDLATLESGSDYRVEVRTLPTAPSETCTVDAPVGQLQGGAVTVAVTCHATWQSVAAGSNHSLGVARDGTLWVWGQNGSGEHGTGAATLGAQHRVPFQIGKERLWAAVAAGTCHSVALAADGTLWAFGCNDHGELGLPDGSTTAQYVPVQVGAGRTWASVSASFGHTVAVASDGTLWAWGSNVTGQLCDGSTTDRLTPTQIGTGTSWSRASAGGLHTLAMSSTGRLFACGQNLQGQLGDGTTTQRLTLTEVQGSRAWRSFGAGQYHSVGVATDGTLLGWGANDAGQVGDGTTTNRISPVVIGAGRTWSGAAASGGYSAATTSAGAVLAWGENYSGQLGDGTTTDRSTPTLIGDGTVTWLVVLPGWSHTLALDASGSLWSWGWNGNGCLGDGTLTNRLAPVRVW